ncbi:YkvA family protein [Algoriphagus vanfongensis]|uniref:YkvA family protein n=1 Tax=Algoriphagus vanfongensis TaxID=426371 RepID=UPI0004250839|nr:YkvA family protein [Algoriphagus vanfongensis]
MGKDKSKGSKILERAKELYGEKVEAMARQESKIKELLQGVIHKLSSLKTNSRIQKLIEPVSVFIRMVKAHFSGTHKMSTTTLGLVLLALVYFLSPVDFIPDFLGFLGFADDLSVIMAVYAKVKDEIEEFLDWERTRMG